MRRVALPSVLFFGLTLAPACGAFGEGEGDAPVTAARSVSCGAQTCTGEDVCCLDGSGERTCGRSCERAFVCDDPADCSGGRVCCVSVSANDRNSAMVGGSTCAPDSDCQRSTSESGPTKFRGCNQLRSDCKSDETCSKLNDVYPTVFPRSQILVCH